MYDEKHQEATYCGSAAVDPPKDGYGRPWPCHDVAQGLELDIKSVVIAEKFTEAHLSKIKCEQSRRDLQRD